MTTSLEHIPIPAEARDALLEDAVKRDLTTARRHSLFQILWRERYLNRGQLISRVDQILGKDCFGRKAWEDTFYRDIRAVKNAFQRSGFDLKYLRAGKNPGYYLEGQPILHEVLIRRLKGALNELDDQQCKIYGEIPPAQKFFQAISMIESGRRAQDIQKAKP